MLFRSLEAARVAVQRSIDDGQLQVRKLELQRDYHTAMVRTSEVKADRDGVVVHGFNNNWIGGRIDEGSSTMPGSKAGEVVSSGRMNVRAWALEPDRRGLKVGQPVDLSFDAVPGKRVPGRIEFISGAPERRPEWGEGRYFTVEEATGFAEAAGFVDVKATDWLSEEPPRPDSQVVTVRCRRP